MSLKIRKIESSSNERIKKFIKDRENFFVYEGGKVVKDIISRGINLRILIAGIHSEMELDHSRINCDEFWLVSDRVMRKISLLKTPPDLISVIDPVTVPVSLSKEKPVFVLYNIQDPGNMGTLFRCAAAFGIEEIIISGACVKLTNNKFIRAAQDSLFDVRVSRFKEISDVFEKLKNRSFNIYLTTVEDNEKTVAASEVELPAAIFIGGEGSGFCRSLLKKYNSIHINQTGKVESLNAGVSGCIIMNDLKKLLSLV